MRLSHTKRVVTGLVVMFALLASSFVAFAGNVKLTATADEPIEGAEWTIMVYLDADNSLEVNGYQDLAEMEKVASVEGVNVIVLFDAMSYEGCHWFYIEPGSNHILNEGTEDRQIDCDCKDVVGACPDELNMGDGGNLTYFVENATAFAPAEKYFLDLWDHGGGWWAICVDESADPLPDGRADRLEMAEAAAAVEATDVHLDVIDYDACFMGMVEVAYENRNIADYMVASITTEPGTGYNYTMMLEMIRDLKTEKSAYNVAKATVNAYIAHYDAFSDAGVGAYPYVSSSVYNIPEVVNLVGVGKDDKGLDALGKVLCDYADDYYLRGAIQSSEAMTPQLQFMGEQFPFIDIGYFTTLLQGKIPDIASIAKGTFEMLDEAVPYVNSVTSNMGTPLKTYGLSVYYTICWGHLYSNYLACGLDFVEDTSWDDFLFAFSQVYVEE